MKKPDKKALNTILRRAVVEIIVEKEFVRLLESGKPLRLKMGFDPSRPDIHLGHVVGLRKLRQLQDLGHKVILIVGDWTAQIGDPSGQTITRPMLTHQEAMDNAKSYMEQFFKVVDPHKTETVLQSEWFGKFTLTDIIDLTRRFTVAQFLERDDFSRRFSQHKPIAITEFLYPLLQGYDSVAIRSDVEFGGTDQKFNLLVGRQLQEKMGQVPQHCFMMPMLVGTDGVQKMSKSLDNYIGVDEPPEDIYGKLMSINDELIITYFDFLTDIPTNELEDIKRSLGGGTVNPMGLKKELALNITSQFYSEKETRKAQELFEQISQHRLAPVDMPQIGFKLDEDGVEFMFVPLNQDNIGRKESLISKDRCVEASSFLAQMGLVKSKAEGKRLISQGAIEINRERFDRKVFLVEDGIVIKVGRRSFVRLVAME
ncbi:MAG: tyrosine--tRNA ligase [Dehalococcoidia bacterium]|nr:tyrosine--tRNA ligase [Dehalococcoidia bacterium]